MRKTRIKPMARSGTLSDVVIDYRSYRGRCGPDEVSTFARESSLRSAVARAGLAREPDGKRYKHQCRLRPAVLAEMQARLLSTDFRELRSFHELYGIVRDRIGGIRGVGELTVYDTALRIGGKLGLEPDRVYLHSGTRVGARNLGLNWRAAFLQVSDLPAKLRVLKPREVEDLLCVFKDELGGKGHPRMRG